MGRRKPKYKPVRSHDPTKAPFVEDGIRLLVAALNTWQDVKTLYSCEGHPGDELFDRPYVEYKGSRERLRLFRVKLKGTFWLIERIKNETQVTYILRPHRRRRDYLSVIEVAKLIINPDFNPKDMDQRFRTFIIDYEAIEGFKGMLRVGKYIHPNDLEKGYQWLSH